MRLCYCNVALRLSYYLATVRWLWHYHTSLHLLNCAATLWRLSFIMLLCHCHATFVYVTCAAAVFLCCHSHDALPLQCCFINRMWLNWVMVHCICHAASPLRSGGKQHLIEKERIFNSLNDMIRLTSWVGSECIELCTIGGCLLVIYTPRQMSNMSVPVHTQLCYTWARGRDL